jgi:Flp pilus assembly protein TadG
MIRRFLKDRRGNFAMIFAIAMLPIMGALTVAIDYSEVSRRRQLMLNALDAAALATARHIDDGATNDEAKAYAKIFFEANLHSLDPADTELTVVLPENNVDGVAVELSAVLTYDPYFLPAFAKLLDKTSGPLKVSATSEVTRASKDIEVALVLDTTGSMAGQAIADLKDAAKELVKIVVQDRQTPNYTKVALVPYSMAVNVGSYAEQVRGSYTSGVCTGPGCQWYTFASPNWNQNTFSISTCVTERTGINAYTDAAPSGTKLGRNYPSPNNPCLTNTILPLSSDKTALEAKIDNLQAGGSTGGHIGVAWGWYMVSPNFGYLWPSASRPASYETEDLNKVVVIMTDGEYNSVYCNGVISKDSINGSGDPRDHINCNAPNGSSYSQAGMLCTNMKTAGIIVYTVGLRVYNKQEAKDLVANCATDASHVYLPNTGTELKQAFRDIAKDISRLRISK